MMKTFGTMGKESCILDQGDERTLFEYAGSGALQHMWFGGSFAGFGQTRIRVYVDHESLPSIDMELHLGHAIAFGRTGAPWGNHYMGALGYTGGVFNHFPIPFARHVRVSAQNTCLSGTEPPLFWWIIRGSAVEQIFLGHQPLPTGARLKLQRLDGCPLQPLDEVAILEAEGAGVLFLVTMAARSANLNYMESCVRAYIGGAREPLYLSSGLEDYFLGTYYFESGLFHLPTAGITHVDRTESSFCAYRFHDRDPVYFDGGLRLTVRCGEELDGKVFHDPQPTTLWSHVWMYAW